MFVNLSKIAAQRTISPIISSPTRLEFMTFARVNSLTSAYGRITSTLLFLHSFFFRLVPQLAFQTDPLPKYEMSVYFFFFPHLHSTALKSTPLVNAPPPVEAPQPSTETQVEQHVGLWHL